MKPPLKLPASRHTPATLPPEPGLTTAKRQELQSLAVDSVEGVRRTCSAALRIGLRVLALYRADASDRSFQSVLAMLGEWEIPRSTAQRWMNAAGNALSRIQGAADAAATVIPEWEPGAAEWEAADAAVAEFASGMTLRRILLGGETVQSSDTNRLEELVDRAESGDPHAAEMLRKVEQGQLTLVQAMRAAAGAAATKGKERTDPVYLDTDGHDGRLVGLFPKCIVTLKNTFACWHTLDESARKLARAEWKQLLIHLPPDLSGRKPQRPFHDET